MASDPSEVTTPEDEPERGRTNASDSSEQAAEHSRRSLLSTLTAVGAASGLAGCSDLLSEGGVTSVEATPAVLHPTGQELFGLPEFDFDEQTRTVSPSDAVGEVEVTSYLTVHSRSRESDAPLPTRFGVSDAAARAVGVLATPSPEVLGEQLNPFASAPFEELLVGERGRQLLSRTDAVDAPDFEWVQPPTRVGSRDVELLGSGTTAESYLGVVETADDRTTVLTTLGRVQRDEDVVLVGEFAWRLTPLEPLDAEVECVDEFCQLQSPTLEGLLERFRTGIGFVGPCGGLAGGGTAVADLCDPVPDLPPPPPKFAITNARLVQVVEDTVVKESGKAPTYTEGDPDLVKGDNTALVFEFDTLEHVDQMSSPLEVEVYSGDPNSNATYELEGSVEFTKSHLQAIDGGEHTISVLHRISETLGNEYPVFELETGRVKLSPKPTASQSGWDTSGVSHTHVYGVGSNDIREVEPLKVGFIALRDSPPGFKSPGDRYGDANGRVRDEVRSFRSSIEYLHRTYPGDLVAYLHTDHPTPGGAGTAGIGAVKKDMKRADNNLQNIATGGLLGSSSFPHGGTLEVYGADRSKAITDIKNNGFDVTVAIVPGIATNNSNASDYYDYHGRSASGLAFWGGGKAVSTEGASTSGIDQRISTTVPQEIGHYFQDDYKDPSGHPMAQRRKDSDNPFQINVDGKPIDPDHARNQGSNRVSGGDAPGVVSTAYDLAPPPASSLEGFANVQHFENPGGSFSVDGPGWNGTPKSSITKVPSYMSYTGKDSESWADARIHQQLIEAGSSGWPVRGGSGSSGARYMLSASGEVDDDDGAIRYDEVTAFRGVDQYTDGDENPVLVELLGRDDEVLERARVPARVRPSHGHAAQEEGPVRLPSFLLPFDEDGVAVRTTFEGEPAFMNPVVRSLRDAVERVPERGFEGDPERARAVVGEALDEVAERMAEEAYDEAAALVDGPVRERIQQAVVEYEAGLDGPSLAALLDLVDRMVTRLE